MKFDKNKAFAIMAERGLSFTQVSDRGGISRQAVNGAMKRGTCRPEALGRIARGLGVQAEAIMIQEVPR